MFKTSVWETLSEVWVKLLFNVVAVPFSVLLVVLITHQVLSVRQYSERLELSNSANSAKAGQASHETLF
ncbi:MAG: hypothetical protein DCF15_10245 [Phormidesmis priestleyi]|uniref:Uncharacterized protein n=1 Tax=Phormidesmis priestleyi TaxID=268141 RepID=A0A2W4ZKX1_9CYAN|nr:MAG: hypothetical protein DCF15_10245 [Phormidesmis priestleyi]